MPSIKQATPPTLGLLSGIGLLLRGRDTGFAYFGRTPLSFIFSLAPLMSLLPLQASLTFSQDGANGPHHAMCEVLAGFCVLLLPAVVSQAVAQHWHRDMLWLRYAIAFNWCRWAVLLLMVTTLMVVVRLNGNKVDSTAAQITVVGFGLYDLWLQWFLVRRGLQLGRDVTTLTVALVNVLAIVLGVAAYLLSQM